MMKLILVPALITLGVTLLRLVGELNGWSQTFFNPASGGGAALVGIWLLVPVFGVYFALKLAGEGRVSGAGRTIVHLVAAIVFTFLVQNLLALPLGIDFNTPSVGGLLILAVASLTGIAITYRGAPQLSQVMLAYGLAARLPVIVIMLLAMLGNWGTHYDVPPPTPEFPQMGVLSKWLLIGVVPQLTVWMAYTVMVGALFGGLALGLARLKRSLRTA